MNLTVFGFGSVGRVLCRQALDIGIGVVAVADSTGVLVSSNSSFSSEELNTISKAKESGKRLSDISTPTATLLQPLDAVDYIAKNSQSPVVADCSAYDDPSTYLLPALARNVPIVLANKKPLTGTMEDFLKLTERRDFIRLESTVGAGLPTMITLRRILDSGDEIKKVEGQLSGTLGYILSALQKGDKFSDVVVDAKAKGFTEPDPRDDLSGVDVARKALIISRCMGQSFNLSDIEIEALYPPEFEDISLDEFMSKLPELDEIVDDKVKSAKGKDKFLRYTATVKPEGIRAGLVEVEKASPLASLEGTDNLISFETKWYTSPTVVRGPGAGVEVTAAGVLSDCMDLYGSKVRTQWGNL
uniref:Homoserine dehydrogenase n=1 Tax=Aplanochytrium stocchinoi TaxID=215587 RepID=A0A7S3PA70_9STRA|mmetsp:Transcript_15454/g.18301  ORF Transcript_15454/g.18301 Transcript_15454/m.18301 type:complete len:358 (+) Transcript_15454:167-1240(+)|eukprot:CAMPEP_0204828764 /NCGR_PEP_ID=MMETSP1346-20131115/6685_1 /ASSEMBLY_ACC=CAM_ASM_000771 /TAXON_ID=215587 /ORGANISM="Aplanochytrium stocchinoi, Strain GSBS06" /LENGTH=357 /DNA_ID=CAMNT_0051958081 /DNA_START=89 /DNA_END=1162 /DNA_ORIENTATION=-